jgi:GntR family transcriptional regulator
LRNITLEIRGREKVKILISNTSDKPLYQQIKDQIKDAILKEELKQGDSLPSIRAFANDLKVSVLTIRRVYEELEQEGFVISQVGIGTSVSASNLELLRDSKRRLVEEKMIDMIQTAKTLKISKEELNTMMDILYGED